MVDTLALGASAKSVGVRVPPSAPKYGALTERLKVLSC